MSSCYCSSPIQAKTLYNYTYTGTLCLTNEDLQVQSSLRQRMPASMTIHVYSQRLFRVEVKLGWHCRAQLPLALRDCVPFEARAVTVLRHLSLALISKMAAA